MYVTLAEIKAHLVIEHDLDDVQLMGYEAAAERAAAGALNCDLSEYVETEGEFAGQLKADVKMILLQIIGNWYENREPVAYSAVNEVPKTLQWLIDLNRKY